MGNKDPSPFKDLESRLKKARGSRASEKKKGGPSPIGVALRVSVELAAGLAIGVAIGYFLDQWLGTGPWLMILFLFLGMAAGIRNVQRAAEDLSQPASDEDETGDDDSSPPSS